jgi:hypothetical protein
MSRKAHLAPEGKSANCHKLKECNRRVDFFSLSESAKSTNQPPERIYRLQLSPDRLWISPREFALWRRRRDHERWVKGFILVDQACTLLVTLTFCRFVTVTHAKDVSRRVVRWLKDGVIESWVRVLERGEGGIHVHLLLRLEGGLSVATGIESIAVTIRRHRRSQRIGRWQVELVRDSDWLSRYLVKTLRPENWRCRVSGRCIEYGRNVERLRYWLDSSRGGGGA